MFYFYISIFKAFFLLIFIIIWVNIYHIFVKILEHNTEKIWKSRIMKSWNERK